MRKPMLNVTLAAAFCLTLAGAAHANCTTVTINPNAKVCTQAEFANAMMCTSGTTSSKAKFHDYWGSTPTNIPTVPGGSNEIAQSGVPVGSFSAAFDSFADPSLFPGWFIICAKNTTPGDITVTICLHPDVSPCPAPGN